MEGPTASLAQSPFAVLTFIVAPAMLTNASTVLAMSTTNRMLRTRDRMHELYKQFEDGKVPAQDEERLLKQVTRVEEQAVLLLRALRCIYVALGCFSGSVLMTLLGTSLAHFQGVAWFRFLAGLGLTLGFGGVASLIVGSTHLLRATQISMINIREEASVIRDRNPRMAKSAAPS